MLSDFAAGQCLSTGIMETGRKTSGLRRKSKVMRPRKLKTVALTRRTSASVISGMAVLLLLVGSGRSSAATRYVAQAGQTPESPYATWTTAASNVQDAVDAAAEGDWVLISNGTYSAAVNLGDKNLHFDAVGSAILSGGFLGTAGLTKLGSGELTLAASNAYEGATTVTGGVLAVVHSNALYGTTNLYIGSGAVVSNVSEELCGGGFWRRNVTNRWAKVSGAGSVWVVKTNLTIGSYGLTSGHRLEIEDGGKVATLAATIGEDSTAVSNAVVISGGGSIWTNEGHFVLGRYGSGNRMFVSNGGRFVALALGMGVRSESRRNVLEVNGSGSQMHLRGPLWVGEYGGSENSIRLFDGGGLYSTNPVFIGFGGVSNSLVVEGSQTCWQIEALYTGTRVGYYGSYNSMTVSNRARVEGGIIVGNHGSDNRLLVTDQTRWTNGYCLGIGAAVGGNNNSARIDHGSQVEVGFIEFGMGTSNQTVLSDSGTIFRTIGLHSWINGSHNRLIVTNGAQLTTTYTTMIGKFGGTNLLQVAGAGSAWFNIGGGTYVGSGGDASRLEILDNAFVCNSNAWVGGDAATTGCMNGVTVSGGAVWSNGTVYVGYRGSGNWVRVTSGGQLHATNGYVGCTPGYEGNRLVVSGGSLIVRTLLEVRNGSNVLDSGTVFAGKLLMTNAAGSFAFGAGLLSTWTAVVNNAQAFLVGDGRQPARYELNGSDNSFAEGLIVNAQGTLAGMGSVQSAVTMSRGSILSPAYTGQVGTLTVNNLVLSNEVEYVYEKNAAAGDTVNVTGTLSFVDAPVVTIRLVDLGGADFTNNAVLFTFASSSGDPKWIVDCGSTGQSNLTVAVEGSSYVLKSGQPGGIGVNPVSLTYETTYHANPAGQVFGVTNGGEVSFAYTNSVSYGIGASDWFAPTPAAASVAGWGMRGHTGVVGASSLELGTYYATNTLVAPGATNSPQTLSIVLTVGKGLQTIAFPNPGAQVSTGRVGLAATASSGLPVSFAVLSGPGQLAGGTNLSFTGAGTVRVVASQAGDANWNPAPEATNAIQVMSLHVLGTNGATIVHGDATPHIADGTDFGELFVGAFQEHRFTIVNDGDETLYVTNLAIGGAGAASFSVSQQPSWAVDPHSTTTFKIRFDAHDEQTRVGTVCITNSVPDNSPYTFNVQGRGLFIAPAEFVCDILPSGGDYADVQSWETAVQCDLVGAETRVFSSSLNGAVNDGAVCELYRLGSSQGLTGRVAHVTDTQALLTDIGNPLFGFQAGDVWRLDAGNYVTIASTGHSAIAVARIGGLWTNATPGFVIDGFTTSSNNYVRIYAESSARHRGKWSEQAFRVEATNHARGLVVVSNNFVELDGLQIRHCTDGTYGEIDTLGLHGREIVLKNLIVWGLDEHANSFRGVYKGDPTGLVFSLYNSIVYGDYDEGVASPSGSGSLRAFNCTVVVPGAGFSRGNGELYAYNCYASSYAGDPAHILRSRCASADASGGSPELTNVAAAADSGAFFISTAEGDEDYRIKWPSLLIDQGANLSAWYDADIVGAARPAAPGLWDVGAHEAWPIYALGTNLSVIMLGEPTASLAKGTDFGMLRLSESVTHTFTITNGWTNAVGLGLIETNAVGSPEDFVVTAQPSAGSLEAGQTAVFQIRFAPSALGPRWAEVRFTNTLICAVDYSFRVQGLGIEPPHVATLPVTNFYAGLAEGVGEVTFDGYAPVTERGFCWSTSTNPTLSSSTLVCGSGLGAFFGWMTNLVGGTSYHVRAWATNAAGLGFGDDVEFIVDIYEPDNTSSDSSFFGHDGSQLHNFHRPSDEDWASFYAPSGYVFDVRTLQIGTNVDTVLELYRQNVDRSLTLVAISDSQGVGEGLGEQIVLNPAPTNAIHCARVTSKNATEVRVEDTQYKLSVNIPTADIGYNLLVIGVDRVFGVALPGESCVVIDQTTNSLGGSISRSFSGLLPGAHAVRIPVPAGYLPWEDPFKPGQVANGSSAYGNPRQVVLTSAWNYACFLFDPYIQVTGLVRDAWSHARLSGVGLSFTPLTGPPASWSNNVHDGYPHFAHYKTPWLTAQGAFPDNVYLPPVNWSLTLRRGDYSNHTYPAIVVAPERGDVFDLGELMLQPTDANVNQMADWWEIVCFGGLTNAAATDDSDDDGLSNGQEYITETHPLDASSVFQVEQLDLLGPTIRWQAVTGHLYRIIAADTPNAPWAPLGSWTNACQPLEFWRDTNEAPRRVYGVEQTRP